MKAEKTERGFAITEFPDQTGKKCSLQKSSLATEDCIWLGVSAVAHKTFRPSPPTDVNDPAWVTFKMPQETYCFSRMHLSRETVQKLLPLLTRFAETGELTE